MEAKRLVLLLFVLLLTLGTRAGFRVVTDPWTAAAVTANAASQKAIESKHNQRLDSIAAKQKKLMAYTAAMASIREIYQFTLQNVEGFGPESQYYKEIFSCAADILTDVPTVLKAIANKTVKNYILCLNELADVTEETEGLVHDFKDIVNNGRIRLPDIPVIKKTISENGKEKNDGYNLLDRYERLTLANKIYSHLLEMKYKMDVIVMMCHYCGWSTVFFDLDPETWASCFTGANMVSGLINDWNGL
ncbi:hypothetical protein NG821_10040 [Prevotella cerevisiae]|uniref:Uncharacterized protein n=1 Tax=Segatella cerevisiae TaxID=2053716 RepID=A0ABT1BYK3_9BACT|nr:hypothetical protein [Segatella cerevisiae]MCO6026175.1 hypothetical protein [Segatella cerevisiae]